MSKELNSIELKVCSKKIRKECTNSEMEELKAVKRKQKKEGDFGAAFAEQERVRINMLHG